MSVNDQELLAAIDRGDVEAARRALDTGARVDARGAGGDPALVLAAIAGEPLLVALLLDRGATVDSVGDTGNTALMHAAARGQSSVVELLLARGADRGHANRWGLGVGDWTRWAPEPAGLVGLIQPNRS